jgi:hypothetical protein
VNTNLTLAISHREPGGRFPPGSQAQLVVDLTGPDGVQQQVRSPEVDLSGLRTAPLLWLDGGNPQQWTIGAPTVSTDPDEEAAGAVVTEVHEIVSAARAAARARADAQRAPRDSRRRWVVVLDHSASMLLRYRSGELGSVLRALLGAWEVFGDGEPVQVWTSAGAPISTRPLGVDLCRESVDDLLRRVYVEVHTGSSLAGLIRAVTPTGVPETVFLLTDDLPPDLESAVGSLTGPGGTGRTGETGQPVQRWHLVVFASSRFDYRGTGRAGNPVSAGEDTLRDVPVVPGVEITSLTTEHTPLADQLREPGPVAALVAALTERSIDLRHPEEVR